MTGMDDMIIRQAEEKDVDELTDLDKACFSRPWSRDAFRRELTKNPLAFYLAAEREGKIRGYAGLWLICDEGHITNVAVHPDFRRHHVASGLMTAMINSGFTENVCRYTLEVRKSNSSAQELYRKFGFREAGLRPGYYGDNGEAALIMWMERHSAADGESICGTDRCREGKC